MNKQAIQKHNAPLHEAMKAKGYELIQKQNLVHYVDSEGKYVPYPVGYITGPQYSNNGNPKPYSMSVQGRNGWHQRSFSSKEINSGEAAKWALETGREILQKNA